MFVPLQVILADSAYPALPNCVPVYKREQNLDAEVQRRRRRFNKVASSTRITVEQCIGTLKLRFPYLLDRLRVRVENASKIFCVACGLHNLLIDMAEG